MKRQIKRKPLQENVLPKKTEPQKTLPQPEKRPENPKRPHREHPNGQPIAQPTEDELEARREQVKEMRFTMGMNYGEIGRALNISKATVCHDMQIIAKDMRIAPTDEERQELSRTIRAKYASLTKRHFRVIPSINPREQPKEYVYALREAGVAVEREEKSLQAAGILRSAPLQVQAVGGIQISPTPEALEYCRMLMEKRKQPVEIQTKAPDGERPSPDEIDIRR